MNGNKTVKIIIKAIPTQQANENVRGYLSRFYNKTKLDLILARLPAEMSLIISEAQAIEIVSELRRLGAIVISDQKQPTVTSKTDYEPVYEQYGKKNFSPVIMIALMIVITFTGYYYYKSERSNSVEIKKRADIISPQETIQKPLPTSPTVKTVAPSQIYSTFLYQYRFKPDNRLLDAFTLLLDRWHQLHQINRTQTNLLIKTYEKDESHFVIELQKDKIPVETIVLTIPFTFNATLNGLEKLLKRLDQSHAVSGIDNTIKLPEQTYRQAQQYLNIVDPRYICTGLSMMERLWQNGHRNPDILTHVARGYALLYMLLDFKECDPSDSLATEAITFLMLARHYGSTSNSQRDKILIAMQMGYRKYAKQQIDAAKNPGMNFENRIFDAYMREDILQLKRIIRNRDSLIGNYLLTRLYRESSLFFKAKEASKELLTKYPALYPALLESINSGNINVVRVLTTLFPVEILNGIEKSIDPDSLNKIPLWLKKMEHYNGEETHISLTEFENKLRRWEPFDNSQEYEFFIDTKRVKNIPRLLYTYSVYARFDLLYNSLAVDESAKKFVNIFSDSDKNHPLIMYMQAQIFKKSDKRNLAENLLIKTIRHPQASGYLVYMAFLKLNKYIDIIANLPVAAVQLDGRPAQLVCMAWLFQNNIHNYELSAKYWQASLNMNPYQYYLYKHLARVYGDEDLLLEAMEKYPYSYKMLFAVAEYFAGQKDPKAMEKAAELYGRARKLAPSRSFLAEKQALMLRKLKRYNEAINVLDQWLYQFGDNSLTTIITRGAKADIYNEMNQPEKALETIGKFIGTYQGDVMDTIARAYEKMGDIKKAENQFRKALDRYPSTAKTIAKTAAFFWRQNDYESAAEIIFNGSSTQPEKSGWFFEEFIRAFEKQPDEHITLAIQALRDKNITIWDIAGLADQLGRKNRKEVAFNILSGLHQHPWSIQYMAITLCAYQVLRDLKGPKEAKHFLLETVPESKKSYLLMNLYEKGLFETLLQISGDPSQYGIHAEFIWLQKLIAWLFTGRDKAFDEKFVQHYNQSSSEFYHLLGRYLLDQCSQPELLANITTPKRRCESAYYIGLKERLRGNFQQTTHWYHICQETLLQRNGEFHWASKELTWWSRIGLDNRHRLLKDDIMASDSKSIIQAL